MSKKKIGIIIAAVVVVLIAGIIGYNVYHRMNYITIDGTEYSRNITELDLSGQVIMELDKLQELTELQQLDIRDTGISFKEYDDLHYALLDCQILWSVPFQNGYCDSNTQELIVTTLNKSDLSALSYLKDLETVRAEGCRDYEALMLLMTRFPYLDIRYTVEFSGTEYPQNQETLELTDPDVDALMENLQYLPNMTTVTLNGTLPDNETMLKLQQAYPDITFDYDFTIFGKSVNTLDTFVDLSGATVGSIEEVKAVVPHFYNLTQVDMVNCGISNANMEALNRSFKDIKFVWTVTVTGVSVRTDITYFMPWQYNIKRLGDCSNLRYCTDLVILDVGHKALFDFSFIEYMPKLEFLGICQDPITDVSVISNCTSLKVLEIFLTNVSDFWPLTNLTNLEDLNISFTPAAKYGQYGIFGDLTPLYQMTWLDRLWMANSRLSSAKETALREALPNTTILFHSDGSTNHGWRQSPNYYIQRDILGMWYMIH